MYSSRGKPAAAPGTDVVGAGTAAVETGEPDTIVIGAALVGDGAELDASCVAPVVAVVVAGGVPEQLLTNVVAAITAQVTERSRPMARTVRDDREVLVKTIRRGSS